MINGIIQADFFSDGSLEKLGTVDGINSLGIYWVSNLIKDLI